jgi:MFS family permease
MAQTQANLIADTRDAVAVALPAASAWRSTSVVLGVAIGMMCSFPSLFNGALSFFLVEWSKDFNWGRGETSTAAVLSMLGMTVGAPLVGRIFDRVGAERVIGGSVLLFAALLYVMSYLPASLIALGILCFVTGLVGSYAHHMHFSGQIDCRFLHSQHLRKRTAFANRGNGAQNPRRKMRYHDKAGTHRAF